MRISVPVTEQGALIAVAAQSEEEVWFLIAIDARLEALNRARFGSAGEVEAVARAHLRSAPPRRPPFRRF